MLNFLKRLIFAITVGISVPLILIECFSRVMLVPIAWLFTGKGLYLMDNNYMFNFIHWFNSILTH